MTLTELKVPAMLRAGTQAFVREHSADIERKLSVPLQALEQRMRRLNGGDGLLLKKRFLEARPAWEKFFWTRIAEHALEGGKPIEDALRLADEDVLMLSSALSPL